MQARVGVGREAEDIPPGKTTDWEREDNGKTQIQGSFPMDALLATAPVASVASAVERTEKGV